MKDATCPHKACYFRLHTEALCSCGCERDSHRAGGRHGCEGLKWAAGMGSYTCVCLAFSAAP